MTDASASSYVHANAAFDDELGRLHLLEARYDPCTFRRLSMFGPLAGARCLEVGAAAGSVARWLAARAGPSGQVVATDTDPRFLADVKKTGVEVRRHDILADPLEPGRYDLAHCRALLLHLADPQRAVRNMAAAVRPGGWLLIEDADYVSLVAANPAHPRAASFDQAARTLTTLIATSGLLDPYLGRRLPLLITAVGLTETGSESDRQRRLQPHRPVLERLPLVLIRLPGAGPGVDLPGQPGQVAPPCAAPSRISSASGRQSSGSLSVQPQIVRANDSDISPAASAAATSGCAAARRTHAV